MSIFRHILLVASLLIGLCAEGRSQSVIESAVEDIGATLSGETYSDLVERRRKGQARFSVGTTPASPPRSRWTASAAALSASTTLSPTVKP